MKTLGLRRRVQQLIHYLKAETRGEYSSERVLELDEYIRRTSRLRHVSVLVLTPLPSLVITLALEFIPLGPPYSGVDANWAVLLRSFGIIGVLSFLIFYQFSHYLPTLRLFRLQQLLLSLGVALVETTTCYIIGRYLGFPIPFSLVTVSPVWATLVTSMMAMVWGRDIYHRYEYFRQPIVNALKVWRCQFSLLSIYPLYYYIHSLLTPVARTVLSLSLPLIKLLLRAWFSSSVSHLGDEVPEVVIFDVDVFNALFMTYCMQMTPSILMTGGLMVLDFAQSFLSLQDIALILREAKRVSLPQKVNHRDLFKEAVRLLRSPNSSTIITWRASPCGVAPPNLFATIHPRPARIQPQPDNNSARFYVKLPQAKNSYQQLVHLEHSKRSFGSRSNQALVESVRHVLFASEYLLLVNYVEVIIPTMFATYVAVVYHLPNRQYLKYIDSMNADHFQTTLFSLYFYSFMEMISLLVLHFTLEYKFQLPGLATLAFVFEKQWGGIQMKLIFWVLFNAQPPLEHFGYDYTFKFAWLRH